MACYYIGAQARFISFHQMVVYLSWIFANGNQWKYAHFASTSHPFPVHFALSFIVRGKCVCCAILPVVGKMHTSFSWMQPCNCVYVFRAHTRITNGRMYARFFFVEKVKNKSSTAATTTMTEQHCIHQMNNLTGQNKNKANERIILWREPIGESEGSYSSAGMHVPSLPLNVHWPQIIHTYIIAVIWKSWPKKRVGGRAIERVNAMDEPTARIVYLCILHTHTYAICILYDRAEQILPEWMNRIKNEHPPN